MLSRSIKMESSNEDNEYGYSFITNENMDTSSNPTEENKIFPDGQKDATPEMKPFIMLKRRHNTLSLEAKVEIIKKLDNGESPSLLASIYNIGRATIFDIRSKKDQILNFASSLENESDLKTRKTLRRKKVENSSTVSSEENADSKTELGSLLSTNDSQTVETVKDGSSGSSSGSKRKHTVLPLGTKLEIIKRLENGESIASLSTIYNVGRATVFDIKNKKKDLIKFALEFNGEDGLKNRKTMRKANDRALEEAIYLWCIENLKQGKAITGPLICEKALELNLKFGGPPDFKASAGWLQNFRSRYGIKQLQPEKEVPVEDKPTESNSALENYLSLLQRDGYTRDDIYITEKFQMNLKSMPTGLSIYQQDLGDPTYVTILMSGNTNWTHVLPLLMIGKTKKEKCFKNACCLPLFYKSQRRGSLDSEILIDWYANEFIPTVTKERYSNGRSGRVLLLLGNERFLPTLDALNIINDNFRVSFLSPDESTLIHSIEQSVVNKFKTMFKIQVFNQLLLLSDSVQSMVDWSQKITIKEFSYMLAESWNSLAEEKLREEWNKALGIPVQYDKHETTSNEKKLKEAIDFLKLIPGLTKCDKEEIRAWLCNNNDSDQQTEEEEEIITPLPDDEFLESEENKDDKTDDGESLDKLPSHFEAFKAFEVIIDWCEQQKECFTDQLLFLKRLKDLAAKKSLMPIQEIKCEK